MMIKKAQYYKIIGLQEVFIQPSRSPVLRITQYAVNQGYNLCAV